MSERVLPEELHLGQGYNHSDGGFLELNQTAEAPSGEIVPWFQVSFVAILSGHTALALVYDALPPILGPIAQHFGGGDKGYLVAQYASTLPYLGVMLAGLLTAYPVKWFGLRVVLFANLIGFGLLGSAGAIINEAWILLTTRFLLGVAVGGMITCCVSYVAVAFAEDRRPRIAAFMIAWASFSAVFLILISGFVAAEFGWRSPFLLHGLIVLLFVVPVLRMKAVTVAEVPRTASGTFSMLRPTLPVFVLAVILQGLMGTFLTQYAFFIGTFPVGTPTVISLTFAVIGVFASASAFIYGRWFTHVPAPAVVAIGFLLIATGMTIGAFSSTLPLFLLSGAVLSTGSAATQSALFAWALKVTPVDVAPRAMGLMFTALYFGISVIPSLAAPFPLLIGFHNVFLLMGTGIVLGIIATLAVRRLRSRPFNARTEPMI